MAAPQVTEYTGTIPVRTQSQTEFNTNTASLLTWWPTSVPEMNTVVDYVNDKAMETEANATDAAISATTALAASNFKGRWSDATGSATVPSSYSHNNADWQLLQDIIDITADEPSNSAPNWKQISYRELYDNDFTYAKDTRVISLVDNRPYISTVDLNSGNEPSANIGTFWIVDLAVLDWGVGRTYSVGEQAFSTIDGRRYTSQLSQAGNEPSVDDGTNWLTEYGKVETPTMLFPLDADTGVQLFPVLQASAYSIIGSDSGQEWANWQIASDAGFTDIVYESGLVTGGDHRVTVGLDGLTSYYVRVAYKGIRTDISDWSPTVQFTTDVGLSSFFNIANSVGNGVALSIDTGIDLLNNAGTVWIANRDQSVNGIRYSTETALKGHDYISSSYPAVDAQGLQSYNETGVTVGSLAGINGSGDKISTYTFKDRAGLFQAVPYVGNGGASERRISHTLGVDCGFFFVRALDTVTATWAYDWSNHIDDSINDAIRLDSGNSTSGLYRGDSGSFGVSGSSSFNVSGASYLAYCFAHNPDAGIYCGFYVGNGSTQTITIGFPVGFVLHTSTSVNKAKILDIKNTNSLSLELNNVADDASSTPAFTADGFIVNGDSNTNGVTYYYVAIADPEQF